MNDEEVLSLAVQDGGKISSIEKNKPSLLHGRAAAVLLKKKFGVTDGDIIESVANHTLGKKNLCALSKIIYAADKIEPGRPQSSDEYRKNLFAKPLDELVLFVVRENMAYLKSRGKKIASSSRQFEKSLAKEIKKGGAKK
jgi:nicotinate-nucleotide adenylyltransferase